MGAHSVRKRCRDCRRSAAGTPGRLEWCDTCGGELAVIPYRQARKAVRTPRSKGA